MNKNVKKTIIKSVIGLVVSIALGTYLYSIFNYLLAEGLVLYCAILPIVILVISRIIIHTILACIQYSKCDEQRNSQVAKLKKVDLASKCVAVALALVIVVPMMIGIINPEAPKETKINIADFVDIESLDNTIGTSHNVSFYNAKAWHSGGKFNADTVSVNFAKLENCPSIFVSHYYDYKYEMLPSTHSVNDPEFKVQEASKNGMTVNYISKDDNTRISIIGMTKHKFIEFSISVADDSQSTIDYSKALQYVYDYLEN